MSTIATKDFQAQPEKSNYNKPNSNRESRIRSILKAVTWRFIATGTTFTLALLVFSNTHCENVLEMSSIVAGLELVIKLVAYYLHERAWQMVPAGTFSPRKSAS